MPARECQIIILLIADELNLTTDGESAVIKKLYV